MDDRPTTATSFDERDEHEEVGGAETEAADHDGEAGADGEEHGKDEQAHVQSEMTEERTRYADLHQELDDLQRAVEDAEELGDLSRDPGTAIRTWARKLKSIVYSARFRRTTHAAIRRK